MSEQKPQTSTSRPPRAGGPKRDKRQPSKHHQAAADARPPTTDKKAKGAPRKPQAPQDNTRYTVIITNVENDFGKLHHASLPRYCELPADFEETADMERLLRTGVESFATTVSGRRGCGYALRCRTETRSAEISFYGPADADFSPMNLVRPTRREKRAATAGSASPPLESASAPVAETVVDMAAGAPLNGVRALALRLQPMHYFEDRLPVHVHLPGFAAGAVLPRTASGDTTSKKEQTQVGVKREREEEEDEVEDKNGDGVDDCELSDGAEDAAESQSDTATAASSKRKGRTWSMQEPTLRQFPSRQKDFVTAVAVLSERPPMRVVRRRLHALPGYMSSWSLDEKRVRVVFRNAETLFKAKELLDQFGLGSGVRMTLMLSDPLSRENDDFVRAQEAEEA